nr:TraX family protein [Pseudomonas sp. NFPP33]AGH89249.1 TrbP-like conjugal transfer protein [uncultured bacterium]
MKARAVAPATAEVGKGGAAALPVLSLSSGAIEGLKWLAIALMTLDHVNKYVFHATLPLAFELGRIAMPLFAFVMAYNLSRPDTLARGSYQRSMRRLAAFGVLTTPISVSLGGLLWGFWPFNILFMLLTAAAVMYLVEKGGQANNSMAALVFIVGGSLVEFWWPAVGFTVACWFYCKRPGWVPLFFAAFCCFALTPINTNFWAMAVFPIIFAAAKINFGLPRSKWYVFYAYYPLHLALILMLQYAIN